LERLNSDIAYEIHQPYHPLNSIFRPHIRIAHIIDNLVILRPYLALTFSAQNPDVLGGNKERKMEILILMFS